MEQDQPVRRDEPLKPSRSPFGLLLAAHGERHADADNAGVARLARGLAAEGVAAEVGAGFIKGTPTVDEAIRALSSRDIVIYPLFLSDGYFTRVALPRLVEQARHQDAARKISILSPLGLDPALGGLIADEALSVALTHAISPADTTVVLLAHGSKKDEASRTAAEQMAEHVRQRRRFRDTRVALLEEAPSLVEATADVRGPVIVVGLFAGEGMHGANDARRLVAELARSDMILIGPVGTFAGIASVIAAAVARHVLASV